MLPTLWWSRAVLRFYTCVRVMVASSLLTLTVYAIAGIHELSIAFNGGTGDYSTVVRPNVQCSFCTHRTACSCAKNLDRASDVGVIYAAHSNDSGCGY